jgi:2,4-dienoyl-CoA reductase-like NADH-dependent reductase (Old Yellow Enzyme family)
MCQYSSHDEHANDWHFVHLGSRAVGGAGLVLTEATAVLAEGRISPEDLGIRANGHIDMLTRIISFIHEPGGIAGMELAHAGRKGRNRQPWEAPGKFPKVKVVGKKVVAPSLETEFTTSSRNWRRRDSDMHVSVTAYNTTVPSGAHRRFAVIRTCDGAR